MTYGPTDLLSGMNEITTRPATAVMQRRAKLLNISESTAFAKPTLPHYRVPLTTFYYLFASV